MQPKAKELLHKYVNYTRGAKKRRNPSGQLPQATLAKVGEWDERVARAAEFDRRADMLKTDELLADDVSGAGRSGAPA